MQIYLWRIYWSLIDIIFYQNPIVPITKIVNFWYDPGDMVTATAWTDAALSRWTCHHLCSVDRGVNEHVSGSESTARAGS